MDISLNTKNYQKPIINNTERIDFMSKVITIGRQFGSAGHDIGKLIAEKLGITFYDKELVEMAAKKSNISNETIKDFDEKASSSLLYSLASGSYSVRGLSGPLYYEMPLNDRLFIAQSDIIKTVAQQGDCVIVGRCADYVLDEVEDVEVLNVFVYAPIDYRVKRVMEAFDITEKQAKDKVLKTDKQRKTYYNYYSNKDWGAMQNYDICLNTSKTSIENCANVIIEYIKGMNK